MAEPTAEQLSQTVDSIVEAVLSDPVLTATLTPRLDLFVSTAVLNLMRFYPFSNVMVIHPAHRMSLLEMVHKHVELDKGFGTEGYDIYLFRSGTFHIEDGAGNWDYGGSFSPQQVGARDLTFYEIPRKFAFFSCLMNDLPFKHT